MSSYDNHTVWFHCPLLLEGIAAAALFTSVATRAEEAGAAEEQQIEEVVVQGIRASLQGAVKAKRDSEQVLDAIVAEDIGKFPDKNIAEALQRVTGVQLTRTQGEGSGISIRGAEPNLNRVEVDGVTQLSPTVGQRSVDFRDLPVEFVNRLEVVKSVNPETIEGGLGGTVRIITRRPFDSREGYVASSSQATWSEIADTWDPKVALIGSHIFEGGKLGVLGSAIYERRRVESHEARTTGWRQIDGDPTRAGVQALDLDGNGSGDFFPEIPRYAINRLDTTRYALNGIIEYRPTDDLDLYAQGTYTDSTQEQGSQFLQITTVGATLDRANTRVESDDTVRHVEFVDNPAAAISNRLAAGYRTILGDVDKESYTVALGANYRLPEWNFGANLSGSKADIFDGYINATADAIGLSRVIVDYDNSNQAPRIILPIDTLSTDGINRVAVQNRPRINSQTEWAAKVDAERLDVSRNVSSIKFGVRFSEAVSDSEEYDRSTTITGVGNPALLAAVQRHAAQAIPSPTEFFNTGDLGYGGGIRNWLNVSDAFADSIGIPDYSGAPNLLATWEVTERSSAAYAQASFRFDIGRPVKGTAGVRAVNTQTTSAGYQSLAGVFQPVEYDGEYTEVLPAINLQSELIENKLLLRLSGTEVIARPTPAQLAPRVFLNGVGNVGTRGNPELEPFRARQYDTALEYYIDDRNYLSATYFRKEIGSFIENRTSPEVFEGVTYAVTIPVNGSEKVTIDGVELGAQLSFDFLEVPILDRTGVVANYTYAKDSGYEGRDFFTGEALPFPGLSRDSYNASLYYEDDRLSARVAYNWRSSYLITQLGRGNNPEFGEAFGQLDGSVSYGVNEWLSVFAEAINLLDETRYENANSTQRRTLIETYGRRVYVGARLKF